MTIGREREKSGESEENIEKDVEGHTCHVCIEREKKIFITVNSTECSCAALQLLLLLVLAGKINVFLYFNDSCVYRERKKIFAIVNSTECSCAALQLLLLLVLASKKNVFVFFMDS